MNLRHPKVIRIFGWGALVTTLLVVAAGGFLAFTFFQSGEMLYCGVGAGMTAASLIIGGLLTYGCFMLSEVMAASQPASVATPETESSAAKVASADDTIAIPTVEMAAALAAPEYSDDAIPVFQAQPEERSHAGLPEESSDAGTEDFFVEDLLVVPPPITVMDDSDAPAGEAVDDVDEFDSRMDLPVTIDAEAASPESSDDVEPAPVIDSSTEAITSAVTPTAEFDVTPQPPAPPAKPMAPALPAATLPTAASLTDAFPDIFKSAPAAATPAPVAVPVPPKSLPAAASIQPPPAMPVARPPAPAVQSRPAAEPKPAALAPRVVAAESPEPLPTAAELPDMATILTPTLPSGGVLPTEIPDFFLKMPTGRSMPAAKPTPPVAPIAPRQVAAPKPPENAAPAAVRIVDSTTVGQVDDDLVTMTSIPDDWPS